MRFALLLVAGCGASDAWKLHVWSEPLDDPKAAELDVPIADGQNGTELVLGVLAKAKAAKASGISQLEIQIGRCIREVSEQPRPEPSVASPEPALDRITLRVRETKYTCRHAMQQVADHGGIPRGLDRITPPPAPGGNSGKRFGDAELVEVEDCGHAPIDHIVTRYRFEVDHQFVPPDWKQIARSTKLELAFGPPHCDASVEKTELRARFHTSVSVGATPPAARVSPHKPSSKDIIALVSNAKAAAEAKRPGEATALAQRALAAWGDGDLLGELDVATATEVADWIAGARFYAVEMEVDQYLHRDRPQQADAAWATEMGAGIDRVAKQYEQIKDLVRIPRAEHWLRMGAGRLASMHLYAAEMLDQLGQPTAAEAERTKARKLAAISSP
jgi:hypothetical protein